MTTARTFLMLLVALAAGCDALRPDPGHDFAVRVLDPSPIPAIGKITIPVHVAVTGCGAFDAAVQGGGTASHPVELAAQADGSFLAAVPIEWLREEDHTCLHDARAPLVIAARLAVTCRDAGRTATVDLAVSYGTATRADLFSYGLPQANIQFVFESADPLRPYALSPSALESIADLYPVISGVPLSIDGLASLEDPLVRPRLAWNASSVFTSAGCGPGRTCPDVTVSASVTVPSEALQGKGAGSLSGVTWWMIFVPAHVIDLAFAEDGALVVLSQHGDFWWDPLATLVTRVAPDPAGRAGEVTVIGYFPGERAQTRFSRTADGQLAFVSFVVPDVIGPLRSVLHVTDGQLVADRRDPTGDVYIGERWDTGSLSYGSVQLAPDAASLVVSVNYLGSDDGSFTALPADGHYWFDGDRGGAAWLTDAVALWSGTSLWWDIPPPFDTGTVEAFEAAPPHARRYRYDVHAATGTTAPVTLYGAAAVGDHVVLTTSTGVRVLGPDGTVVAGSDPLPCGLSPTSVAVRTGPTTFAVGAGRYLYVFDLAEP